MLVESLELFDVTVRLAEWTKAPYMIENPVRTVSTYWQKPDYTFDPCDYGGYLSPPDDAYTKNLSLDGKWICDAAGAPRYPG